MSKKIFCLGKDSALQESRRAVLKHHGYEVFVATHPEQTRGHIDLIIVSARFLEQYRELLPADIPLLVTDGVTLPVELLRGVEEHLRRG